MSKSRTAAALALVAVAGGLLVFFLSRADGRDGARGPGAVPVVTAQTFRARFADEIDVIGTAQSNESIEVTAKVTEVVTRVRFTDGQQVEAGDILIELTDDVQSADLKEAHAALLEAEQQYERISDLFKRGTRTRANLDSAIARRDQALARVKATEARLADRLIRAPFSGVLGLRLVSPGTLIEPGDVITTLDDISIIKYDFSVPESYLGSLRIGMEIRATTVAYPDREFVGRVTAVDTRIDPETRAIKVRAEIANPDGLLKPGMLLVATVRNNVKTSTAISDEAVLQREDQHYVFVVKPLPDEGLTVERRDIEIGRRQPGLLEVREGLSVGEEIVVQGINRVIPGRPIDRVDQMAPPPESMPPEA